MGSSISEILSGGATGYEKIIFDKYIEAVVNGSEPDEQLVHEMFRFFPAMELISFGKVVFKRENFNVLP